MRVIAVSALKEVDAVGVSPEPSPCRRRLVPPYVTHSFSLTGPVRAERAVMAPRAEGITRVKADQLGGSGALTG